MYETGVGRRVGAAFEALSAVDAPGDIGATSRYFSVDVTTPPYETEAGYVTLNTPGNEFGIGCELDKDEESHRAKLVV